MAYTEIKEKNNNKYYYRVQSIRQKDKIKKKRYYLGSNLSPKVLRDKEIEADKELKLLSTLLTKEELEELNNIKKDFSKIPKETKENRYEAFISQFTHESTTIEGNTLSLQETAQLLFEDYTPRKSLREINEIINHKEAFDYLFSEEREISKNLILKLHRLTIKNTVKKELENQIGKYRTLQVYIKGTEWLPPKPKEIGREMQSLLTWYTKNRDKLHPIILAAYFHSAFETIHPFIDGNGRVGRLLTNLILHNNKLPMINIPNKQKHVYYNALEESQLNGNLRPLIKFIIKQLKENKIQY